MKATSPDGLYLGLFFLELQLYGFFFDPDWDAHCQ
jgi:hypothetical protein